MRSKNAALSAPLRTAAILVLAGLAATACRPATESADAASQHDLHEHHAENAAPEAREDRVAYYTCSMHPSVRADAPGACPICGMTLVAVTETEAATGTILIDEAQRRQAGIATSTVERRSMRRDIRTVARIAYDEKKLREITLKVSGWVSTLEADETGVAIRAGEPLLTFYSPDLYTAQLELQHAVESREEAERAGLSERAQYLITAARQKLRLWDVPDDRIAEIERRSEPYRDMPIFSPVSGYVIAKNVVQGDYVAAGQSLYRIAELDQVWVQADIYESDFALVREGQLVLVELPYLPDRKYRARIGYVYPYLDPRTRTGSVRIELANDPERPELKPDMYASVAIEVDLGERLAVPASAVVTTGTRSLVFVDHGEGRLVPTEVRTGLRAGEYYEVLSGLQPGEHVVTSGNFLVASESRIRSAEQHWGATEHETHGSH